jgi:lysophospholipase L1-like esterase
MQESFSWRTVTPELLEGKGWSQTESPFDRLPTTAKGRVPDSVWGLSHHSAGLCVTFRTTSPHLSLRWSLTSPSLAMPHMPATGVSGVDVYGQNKAGVWRYIAVGQPRQQADNTHTFYAAVPGEAAIGSRLFRLYLPLYNSVMKLEIGTHVGHTVEFVAPRPSPIVFYGTSITQGACASRPGLAFTAIVGRNLNVHVINLGFSGSGKMEPALADLLCHLTPRLIVLDCLRNMTDEMVTERAEPFIRTLRTHFQTTPIGLAEDAFLENPKTTSRGKILFGVYEKLRREGMKHLHYLPMQTAWGTDGEGTVDTVHPNDIGMMRYAETFTRQLRPLLETLKGV